ncbi:hypothetical protein [Chryseobacterium hagamense]|uniref:Uncharacterized protein n=1 Tax=Chryseobacterium hagamense TaxID=395935 RepID=A0A511YKC3_9FLAO|nr:hypothetical protein [Chryseobacterium hagamense]GEN75623.1 hypothetical protein CHA01nite_13630 [Chryseobacterium hagamense]
MKRKIILRLSYLIVFLTVFWSCNNEDFANGNVEPQRNNANFFLHSTKGGAAARGSVDYVAILQAYNDEKDFLSTMPDQQGMPVWDKMQVLDNGEKTVLYVPLSADQTGLSSLLIVNIDEENAVSRLQNFTNDYLEAYVYNADNPTAKRKLLMDTFLQMDFFTFGHQEFTNLPKDLYKGSTEYNRLNIPAIKIEAEHSKGFIYNTVCTTFHYCVHGQGTSNCDYGNCTCGGFISCFVVTSCTTTATWIDDPFPSFPGSHGGGGGGGIPIDHPKDPCTQAKVFYRVLPGCNGGGIGDGGSDEELLPPQSPCETLTKAKQNPKVNNALEDLKPKTLLEKEFTYEIERKYNNATQDYDYDTNLKEGVGFSVVVSYGGFIKGNAHNHPSNGVRIPSVGDIMWLKLCKENIAPSKAVAYNIVVCSNPVSPNDPTKANIYAIATDDSNTISIKVDDMLDRSDLSSLNYDGKRDQLLAEDDKYYAGLDDNPTELEKKFLQKYGNFGLGLYKFDKTANKWMKITLENNTIISTPCE